MGAGLYGSGQPVMEETFLSTAAVTPWRWCDDLGNVITVAGAQAAGISAAMDTLSATDITNKRPTRLTTLGSAPLELGGTVAAGDLVTTDNQGRGVKWVAGSGWNVLGVAREGGALGDRVRVFVFGSQRAALPAGTAVLVAGTVTVNTALVKTGAIIMLTYSVPGGAQGFLRVSAIVNGTSFTISSSSGTDTSTVAWAIVG
jgi:hypothetical protein